MGRTSLDRPMGTGDYIRPHGVLRIPRQVNPSERMEGPVPTGESFPRGYAGRHGSTPQGPEGPSGKDDGGRVVFDLLGLLRNKRDKEELAHAKRATSAGEEEVKGLTMELRAIDQENHIAAKVHAAFRGE